MKKSLFLIMVLLLFFGCEKKEDRGSVVLDQDLLIKPGISSMAVFYKGDFAYSFLVTNQSERVYFTDGNIMNANGVTKKNLRLASSEDNQEGILAKTNTQGFLLVKKGSKLKVLGSE